MEYKELEMPQSGDTVAVGMSGGVDSTLAAVLLKEKGCNVIGVTMSLWKGGAANLSGGRKTHSSCYGPDEIEDIAECKAFCRDNDIEYHVLDVSEQYQKNVLNYVISEYRAGRTPNPCVRCNSFVKFGALLEGVRQLGLNYDYFCTGHYAKVVRPINGIWNSNKHPAMVACAADTKKDQSYFLYGVSSDTLEKVRFPLSDLTKKETVKMACDRHLYAAKKAESQDFMSGAYFDTLFSGKPSASGDIVDMNGHKLGVHSGIEHYTIGQRRGLGVSSKRPLYVYAIDAKKNTIVLSDAVDLDCTGLVANDWFWPAGVEPNKNFDALVKIRFASPFVQAHVENLGSGEYRIMFFQAQKAVAPGQAAVLYKDGAVIGGGVIVKSLP